MLKIIVGFYSPINQITLHDLDLFLRFFPYISMSRYAATFAAFVAGMACSVGIDYGAKLLASLAKCFEVNDLQSSI